MTDDAVVVVADGRLVFVEDEGRRMRSAPRVPRNDSWDSVEASAIGVRAGGLYVAFGNAYAILGLNPAPQWSERRSTDEFLSTMVGDITGEIVAFAGREATTVFGLDGSAKTAPKTRRVSGQRQHNAVLTASRMLIHGHIDSEWPAVQPSSLLRSGSATRPQLSPELRGSDMDEWWGVARN